VTQRLTVWIEVSCIVEAANASMSINEDTRAEGIPRPGVTLSPARLYSAPDGYLLYRHARSQIPSSKCEKSCTLMSKLVWQSAFGSRLARYRCNSVDSSVQHVILSSWTRSSRISAKCDESCFAGAKLLRRQRT
jgi:hypothetical protein